MRLAREGLARPLITMLPFPVTSVLSVLLVAYTSASLAGLCKWRIGWAWGLLRMGW